MSCDTLIPIFLGLFGYAPFIKHWRPLGQGGLIPLKKMISLRILPYTVWSKTDYGVPVSINSYLSIRKRASGHQGKEPC